MTRSIKAFLIIWVALFATHSLYAQIGGNRSFEFNNVPTTARLAGLGGVNVSLVGQDINLAFSNPALATDTLSGQASFSYLNYVADVNTVSAAYQHKFEKWGSWFMGVSRFSYGEMEGYDATGAYLNDFNAGETVVYLGSSHQIGNFIMGSSLKFFNSNIDVYNANALAVDLGGAFVHPTANFTAGLVFKNIGFKFNDYTETANSKLPFDIQAGVTYKPLHMPFRFSLTAYNLYQGNISYYNPQSVIVEEEKGTFDKVMRHVVIGAEVLLTKNINLRLGYNHLVRQELKLENTAGGAGFSFGFMAKIKAFSIAYSRVGYHAAGGSNVFTLTANTNLFFRKRTM